MVFGGVNLEQTIRDLESAGFYQVLLPFILIFTIIFAILQKVQLFGTTNSKNINVIVAVAIAFFTIRAAPVVSLINQFLPKVSAMVLVLMMFLLIMGIFGITSEGWTGWPFFLAVFASVVGVGWSVFSSIPGMATQLPSWLRLDASNKGYVVFIGVILLIYVLFKDDGGSSRATKFRDEFGPQYFGRPQGGKH